MNMRNFKVGERYGNSFVEKALGSKVVYLCVKDTDDTKRLVIIEGVGTGKFVLNNNHKSKANKIFWRSFYSEKAAGVVKKLCELLNSKGKPNFVKMVKSIADNKNEHPVVRNSAKLILKEI